MSKKTNQTVAPEVQVMKCITITGKIYYWTGGTHDVNGALVTMRDRDDTLFIPEHDAARLAEVTKIAKRIEQGTKSIISKNTGKPVGEINLSARDKAFAWQEAIRERCKKELMLV